MEKEAILIFNDEDELVGAIGYIHGTGEYNYENREIIQIQTVFIDEAYRHTRLFYRGLQFLAQHLQESAQPITELRFWAPAHAELYQLFSKFAERTATTDHAAFGLLDEYRIRFLELLAYTNRMKGTTPC